MTAEFAREIADWLWNEEMRADAYQWPDTKRLCMELQEEYLDYARNKDAHK